VKHGIALTAALAAAWFLWSGHTEPLILGLGGLSVALVVWLVDRMGRLDGEVAPLEFLPRALTYLPWLLLQIVRSNLQVAAIILHPSRPIAPRIIRQRTGQRTEIGRVIYANSITLTPGTVSIELNDEEVVVHALDRRFADGVLDGTMDARVTALEPTE